MGDFLRIGHYGRMAHGSGDDHRQHEFAILVSQGGGHKASHTAPSNRLAESLVEHGSQVEVESLVDEVDGASSGHRSDIKCCLQVVGIGHSAADVEGAAHARDGRIALGELPPNLRDLAQFIQQVEFVEPAVGESKGERTVEGLRHVSRSGSGKSLINGCVQGSATHCLSIFATAVNSLLASAPVSFALTAKFDTSWRRSAVMLPAICPP